MARLGPSGLLRAAPLRASLVVTLALAVVSNLLWDRSLALYFKALDATPLVGLFRDITDLGKPDPWFVILAFAALLARAAGILFGIDGRRDVLRRVQDAAVFLFLSVALSGLFVNLLKLLAGRHRPRDLFADGDGGFNLLAFDPALNSFPSGHAQMSLALAVGLMIVLPRFDHVFLVAAVVIAFSRVATSVHYLSDVLVGAWIGVWAPILLHRHVFARRRLDVTFGRPGRLSAGLRRWLRGTPRVATSAHSPPKEPGS